MAPNQLPSKAHPVDGGAASRGRVSSVAALGAEDDHLNTDERPKGEWESRYPMAARKEIRLEGWYVAILLGLTLIAIFLTWRGTVFAQLAGSCASCSQTTFNRYAYFYLGGQLGGTLFGVKYLYNVVARGWWNVDRRLWRLFSPFLSGGLALAVAAMVDSGILGLTTKATSGAAYFSLGFVTGYFADSALRKMKEIADTIVGSPESHASHLLTKRSKKK
jgi:hypothetical protein